MPRPPNPDKQPPPRKDPGEFAARSTHSYDLVAATNFEMRCTARPIGDNTSFSDDGCTRMYPTSHNDTHGRGSEGSHG